MLALRRVDPDAAARSHAARIGQEVRTILLSTCSQGISPRHSSRICFLGRRSRHTRLQLGKRGHRLAMQVHGEHYLFIRGRKRKMWVARWREDVIQANGAVHRVLPSETLGRVSEIAGRSEARMLLQNRLASLNSGQRRAEATMTFGTFVAEQFVPDILPTLKYATQKIPAALRVAETCYQGHFGTPKSKSSRRELPLPRVVVRALLAHRSLSSNTSAEALVFSTCRGTPLASNNLRRRQLHPACARAELAPITWHTLRHTRGTLLHGQGTPLRVAQAQLGHSHMTTTLGVYARQRERTEARRRSTWKSIVPKCSRVCPTRAEAELTKSLICGQMAGGRDRDRTGDLLLAKTRKKIYLIGSLGFVLCRSTRFWT
jgi:hypothetical protein